jgi:3-deoxy-D-arabino-heptulosonate 7-phosphate (DAHP) synthase class II
VSALITVYAQAATYQAMQLITYSDTADALNEMHPLGYSGNISVDDTGAWQRKLVRDSNSIEQSRR